MSDSDKIIRDMNHLVSSYVSCWQKGENRFIKPAQPTGINSPNLILANNITECEKRYSLFIKVDEQRQQWRYRLEDLPFEVVIELPILLTRSLKAQSVSPDHLVLWSWIAQLITSFNTNDSIQDAALKDGELKQSFKLLVHLELATIKKPPMNPDIIKLNKVIDDVISWHVEEIVQNKYTLSLTFSFPILEGLLRRKCSSFVDGTGTVIYDFPFQGKKYRRGRRISNLADLLNLYEEAVATPDMKESLRAFKSELEEIFSIETDAYDLLYSWRNDQLHGSKLSQTYHAVVLNLISILLLDSMNQVYDALRSRVAQRPNAWFPERTLWDFYPPEFF